MRTLRRVALAATALPTLGGCLRVRPPTTRPACSASPPADATPFDPARLDALVGTFEVRDVWTSAGAEGAEGRWRLRLAVNTDTLRRYYVYRTFRGYVRQGERPLVGTRVVTDEAGHRYTAPAELEGSAIYVGGRGGFDSSPAEYVVRAVSPRGFWGTWEDRLTGIGRPVGRDGKMMDSAGGCFCATRVAAHDS